MNQGELDGGRFRLPLRSSELGLCLAIVAVVLLTALLDANHNYFRNPWGSLIDVARQTSLLGIFALGAAVVIISGGIDLSSGSMIAFSGTICATLMVILAPQQVSLGAPLGSYTLLGLTLPVAVWAVLGTLVVGFLVGTLHAWLITVIHLPPFIATLATLVGLRSLGRAICESVTEANLGGKSTQIQVFDPGFRDITTAVWFQVVVLLVLAATIWFLMSRTVVGRHLYALGGNEQAARLSGIRTDRVKWLAYCIGTLTSTIAGIFYIGEQSVADPQTLGRGYELNAIAAAVVGGCSLQGGIGTIPGTVLGALFLRTVIDGVAKIIRTGADVYEGLIVGLVVVVAVAFSQLREAMRQHRELFPGAMGGFAVVTLAILAAVLATLTAGGMAGYITGGIALVALAAAKMLSLRKST